LVMLLLVAVGTVRADNNSLTLWAAVSNPLYEGSSLDLMGGYRRVLTDNLDGEIGVVGQIASVNETFTYTTIDDVKVSKCGKVTINESDHTYTIATPQYALGGYIMVHLTNAIEVPNPLANYVSWLPKTLLSEPFVGVQYLKYLTMDATAIAPMTGIRVLDFFTVYYKYSTYQGEPLSDNGEIGVSLRWKF